MFAGIRNVFSLKQFFGRIDQDGSRGVASDNTSPSLNAIVSENLVGSRFDTACEFVVQRTEDQSKVPSLLLSASSEHLGSDLMSEDPATTQLNASRHCSDFKVEVSKASTPLSEDFDLLGFSSLSFEDSETDDQSSVVEQWKPLNLTRRESNASEESFFQTPDRVESASFFQTVGQVESASSFQTVGRFERASSPSRALEFLSVRCLPCLRNLCLSYEE